MRSVIWLFVGALLAAGCGSNQPTPTAGSDSTKARKVSDPVRGVAELPPVKAPPK